MVSRLKPSELQTTPSGTPSLTTPKMGQSPIEFNRTNPFPREMIPKKMHNA